MSWLPPLPGFISGFSRSGDRMKPPDLFSRYLVEGRNHTVCAVLTTAHARYDEIASEKRRRLRIVVLTPVRNFRLPQQLSCHAVQGEYVSPVSFEENSVSSDAYASITSTTCCHARLARRFEMPDLASCPSIQCVTLIGGGYVHDPLRHYGRDLQMSGVRNCENPFRCQPAEIVFIDLGQRGEPISSGVAIISRPSSS